MSDQITTLIAECHQMAKDKGWYDSKREIPELLCLIHSEISEALEAYRDGEMKTELGKDNKPEGFPVEIADAVIRIFDMCGAFGIDLSEAIRIKMEYNSTRPHRHGGKVC